ncbi:glycosyltransferase [Gammaproteobacteria bacterium]|nr:glycosyltransferase [Gammaproteobacteria bacterium]MDB2376456.1 glycosyltransferase [Gammaproteobacteria bacterium]
MTTVLPLVSIIVRTVGRPELTEALASIAAQSHTNIETLIVDARGDGLPSLQLIAGQTLVSTGAPLGRPKAANAGLDAVSGEFVMFLDDDDWLSASHVENLVHELQSSPTSIAVYSTTQRTTASGELLDEFFARDFDIAFLRRDNFMPIHSVLFRSQALAAGCRVDETLDIYEDWDFWLQVATLGSIYHIDKITAFYRAGGDSETAVDTEQEKYDAKSTSGKWREKVLAKWAPTWSAAELNTVFGTFDVSAEIEDLHKHLRLSQEEYQAAIKAARQDLLTSFSAERNVFAEQVRSLQLERDELNRNIENLQTQQKRLSKAHQLLNLQHQNLSADLTLILNSFSWRITKPYRYLSNRAKRLFSRPTAFPSDKVTTEIPAQPLSTEAKAKSSRSQIECSIDVPGRNIHLVDDDLVLAGWAFSAGNKTTISVSIGKKLYRTFEPILKRDDVAASFRATAEARESGFLETIEKRFLPLGRFTVVVTFDNGRDQVSLEREIVNLERVDIYRLWLSERAAQTLPSPDQLLHKVAVLVLADASGNDLDAAVSLLEKHTSVATVSSVIMSGRDSKVFATDLLRTLHDAAESADDLVVAHQTDVLAPHALQILSSTGEELAADLVYSDHDRFDSQGQHTDPEFTFGWSPEHLLGRNYIGGVYLFSATLFKRINTPAFSESVASVLEKNPEAAATFRYCLLLELGNAAKKVARVPDVLWTESTMPSTLRLTESLWASNFLDRFEPGSSLREHSANNSANNSSNNSPNDGLDTVRYVDRPLQSAPLVSIIIPTMAKLELVTPCIETLLSLTDYSNFEIVILDNSRGKNPDGISYLIDKGLKVIECDFDFNWPRLNNLGAKESDGELLLFLNDDVEITDAGWLTELVKQAQRSCVGTVGALLYYPEGMLQHAGVFLVDTGGGCAHLFHKMAPSSELRGNLHNLVREVSANTGACLLVSRENFAAVGGFDEGLAVVGNDIDLCLKLRQKGLVNIWTPRCSLIHNESISRKASVPKEDEALMWNKWGELFRSGDEYYNPNLTLTGVDCAANLTLPPSLLESKTAKASGSPSLLETSPQKGVNLIGYIRAEMGVGEGARSDARALAAADIEFGVINFERGNSARMGDTSWQHKERDDAPFSVTLWHINADHLALARATIPTFLVEKSYHIAYWAWELETMPEGWRPALDEADEIWVPSEFVRRAIASETTKPVVCIPHCVAPNPVESLDRDYFGLPKDSFIFLAMYDTRSIAERKNPKAALHAFIAAFGADDNRATLVLKVNNATTDSLRELDEAIGSHQNIIILKEDHSKPEIDSLINAVDCFVSLHRSEGFGLGPAEAMSLGKSVILTNWSGSTDYTDADHCLPIDYQLITLEQDYGPYLKGQRWAEPSIEDASAAMRKLVNEPAFADEIGKKAQVFIDAEFSPRAVGEKMKSRLAEIS